MRKFIPAVLAAVVVAPAPVLAAEPDWAAASAAYVKGKESGPPPKSAEDFVVCAAYWSSWVDAQHEAKVSSQARAGLASELVVPDAELMAFGWLLSIGEDPVTEAAYERYAKSSAWLLGKGLEGQQDQLNGVTEMLGACQLPKE